MLCQACERFFSSERILHPRYSSGEIGECAFLHHASGRDLFAAAVSGCQLCSMLANQVSPSDKAVMLQDPREVDPTANLDDFATTINLSLYSIRGSAWPFGGFYAIPVNGTRQPRRISYEVELRHSEVNQCPLPEPEATPSAVVGAGDASLSLVKDWLAQCDDSHTACRNRCSWHVTGTRPKNERTAGPNPGKVEPVGSRAAVVRLVDIGDYQLKGRNPRLVEFAYNDHERTNMPLYLTLSHCWGGHQPLRLTSKDLEAFKTSIPWNTLPRTFADAMRFTSTLGLQFIWIDSLCIIQDDDADWKNQAGLMCEIYTGSYLNISATGSDNPDGGLFLDRSDTMASIPPLRVLVHNPSELGICIPNTPKFPVAQYFDVLYDAWIRDVDSAPLCHRAWVVQERVLPRRCLHFGKSQLYWECPEMRANETFPSGMEDTTVAREYQSTFKMHDPLRADLPLDGSEVVGFLSVWARIVEVYTESQLTEEKDRPFAIHGIVKCLALRSDLEYLAGLWNWQLPVQLLWRALIPARRPRDCSAPSWSWLSTLSPVIMAGVRGRGTTLIDVVSTPAFASMVEFETNPCPIRLCGDLIPGKLSVRSGDEDPNCLDIRGSTWNWFFPDAYTDDHPYEKEGMNVVLLPVRSEVPLGHISGLVLKPYGRKGVFTRIGFSLICIGTIDPLESLDDYKSREEVHSDFYHEFVEEGDVRRQKLERAKFIFDII